jgi:hypothetical protein
MLECGSIKADAVRCFRDISAVSVQCGNGGFQSLLR